MAYASRIEELFSEALEMQTVLPSQEKRMLKSILYQGLRHR